ncbi:class I SAM-dependent methyltransferase [Brevibacterium litoralis]|uniref:class I SAM-dependent methyltransferase n=1 Tax=Brevibacterium litoralis TaxID=3138935 RepID=UPI0032F07281
MASHLLESSSSEFWNARARGAGDGAGSSVPDLPEFSAWPEGTPVGAIVLEYLAGRAAGVLDVSGRPVEGARSGDGRAAAVQLPGERGGRILVVDDDTGEIAHAVRTVHPEVPLSVYADSVVAAPEVDVDLLVHGGEADAEVGRGESVGAGGAGSGGAVGQEIDTVVMHAPKAVDTLEETLLALAESVKTVVVAGRDKHMSRSLGEVLGRRFDRVDVSPGMGKSRLLIASEPLPPESRGYTAPYPRSARIPAAARGLLAVTVHAHGAVFGGVKKDPGTDLLVRTLGERVQAGDVTFGAGDGPGAGGALEAGGSPEAGEGSGLRVLDLGCGNGWLLANLAVLFPGVQLTGTDVSRAAGASAAATVEGLRAEGDTVVADVGFHLADAGERLPEGRFDLVSLNPPFHEGTSVTKQTARRMIDRAHRLLAPGGLLVMVFNSHLQYRPVVSKTFGGGRVEQWARDRRFTVLAARKG